MKGMKAKGKALQFLSPFLFIAMGVETLPPIGDWGAVFLPGIVEQRPTAKVAVCPTPTDGSALG